MNKKNKIISFSTGKEITNDKQEEFDNKFFEEDEYDFEEWEVEHALTEAEDWEGLIKYYQAKIDRCKSDYYIETCVQLARVYTEKLKQYQKAIDYLIPYCEKEPDIKILKQEIELAKNFINKKIIKLTKKDLKIGFNSDILRLFDFDSKMASENKTFNQNLNMLFKKYEYVQVDTDNNIYAVTKENKKDFITNNYDSYISAHDLLNF